MSSPSSRVAETVWPWRNPPRPQRETPGQRRKRACIQGAIVLTIAALIGLWLDHRVMGIIVATIGGLTLVGGLFIPPLFHGIEVFGKWLAKVVLGGLTWVLLTPVYYLLFTPGRLIQKLAGKDPMQRQFSKGDTYWTPRKKVEGTEYYRRQY